MRAHGTEGESKGGRESTVNERHAIFPSGARSRIQLSRTFCEQPSVKLKLYIFQAVEK